MVNTKNRIRNDVRASVDRLANEAEPSKLGGDPRICATELKSILCPIIAVYSDWGSKQGVRVRPLITGEARNYLHEIGFDQGFCNDWYRTLK
tara:strand:+ start:3723 stop:3998 length:276 start_codon:yes stop_codon:yes gene_type:complete